MIHPYQLHPLSKLYREETLREARAQPGASGESAP